MNRREFVGLLTAGAAAPQAVVSAMDRPEGGGARPNFLFMIADDLTYRAIHSLNNPEIHTPNLDRLSASGCTFTHCFHQGAWNGAVCVPSRTMLNSGLTTFKAERGIDEVHTWGQTMGSAGYDTYLCGKWHLNPTLLQRSFKELGPVGPGFLPSGANVHYTDMATDLDHDFPNPPLRQQAAYFRPRPGDTWDPADRSNRGHWLHTNLVAGRKPDAIEHSSAVYADSVIGQLKKAAARSTPFFIYLGFNAPHDPRQSPQDCLDLYPRDRIEVPPNFLPEHPFNIGQGVDRDESLAPFPRTREAVQTHRREYYSIITHMDRQVGRVLDALERTGKAANTYVILTADHGLAVGEHGLMGKQNLYDCSVRMPLLISGPGVPAGKRVDELVYQHSMYATTCELAGIPVPETVEFPSLAGLVLDRARPLHDAMFCWFRRFQRSVRTKTHKLIVYPAPRRIQLFDLENDPWEMRDISGEPLMAPVMAALMERLKRFQKELGDPNPIGDPLRGVWPEVTARR